MPSITRRRTANIGRPTSAETDILAATQRLLINGANFTELGVQHICTEAGVARSTFYSHFRDKIDLIMRLATELLTSTFDVTSAWTPSDGVEALEDVFLRVVRVYREHAAARRALAEVAGYDATVRDFWKAELDQFTDRTITVLRAEQDAGRTPAALDPVSATRLIIMGGERAIVDHVTSEDPASDATFARELALTWWYGVYRRPADHP
ncbi:TetR/AcrR family transcriptional regulator [Microbispora sp. RL4-1S]|uniref:TetR/AcrR family transcriptional regulator n=1 Tax=Microbispora oryzae TaxID=2806554 RepID=A0A941APN5_9ACTN|nr:TetR/AcrR family transcriptional regulator [Microbispora oryzae]MBP2703874.1 TetR/AcrR family transcriptional regulator [Microbispora oryzae]